MAHFDEVRSVGGTLLAIGNGTPVMAQDFVEKFGIAYPVYTDPSRQTYALAGLKKTFGMKFSTFGRAKRAKAAGHSQGRMAGNAWQQGGLLVVDSDGSVAFYHADGGPGEHGDLAAAVRALVDSTVV